MKALRIIHWIFRLIIWAPVFAVLWIAWGILALGVRCIGRTSKP